MRIGRPARGGSRMGSVSHLTAKNESRTMEGAQRICIETLMNNGVNNFCPLFAPVNSGCYNLLHSFLIRIFNLSRTTFPLESE